MEIPPIEDQRAYEALYFGRPDPTLADGSLPAYRIVTKIPVQAGRSVLFYSEPVQSLRELGWIVKGMREAAPKRFSGPWYPAVQYRSSAEQPWQDLSAFEWESAWNALSE